MPQVTKNGKFGKNKLSAAQASKWLRELLMRDQEKHNRWGVQFN
jgi:hypothetical protein